MNSCLLFERDSSPCRRNLGYPQKSLSFLFLFVLVFSSSVLYAQQIIKGRVIVGDTAIAGATIQVKGTQTATQTDANGNFSINAPGNATLLVSSIGYGSKEVKVGNETFINVELQSSVNTMGEVVVVGYGIQRRKNLTGAVSTITGKDLEGRPVRATTQALQGKVPGLVISSTSAQPGSEEISLNIRGVNSFSKSTTPLILIDGVEGNMDALSPEMIENITILKGASSAAIYGSRSANGIILVTTKRGAAGKVQITYNTYFSTQKRALKYESIQDPVEYMTLYNNALKKYNGSNHRFLYTGGY